MNVKKDTRAVTIQPAIGGFVVHLIEDENNKQEAYVFTDFKEFTYFLEEHLLEKAVPNYEVKESIYSYNGNPVFGGGS